MCLLTSLHFLLSSALLSSPLSYASLLSYPHLSSLFLLVSYPFLYPLSSSLRSSFFCFFLRLLSPPLSSFFPLFISLVLFVSQCLIYPLLSYLLSSFSLSVFLIFIPFFSPLLSSLFFFVSQPPPLALSSLFFIYLCSGLFWFSITMTMNTKSSWDRVIWYYMSLPSCYTDDQVSADCVEWLILAWFLFFFISNPQSQTFYLWIRWFEHFI